jgi:hypothetical protein
LPIWEGAATVAGFNGKLKYDICKIQKTIITPETKAVRHSLVSKLQNLRAPWQ